MNSVLEGKANLSLVISASTVLAVIIALLGFWQEREKALWTISAQQDKIDREINMIIEGNKDETRTLDAIRTRMKSTEDRTQINADRILRMEAILDRIYPQGDNKK